MPDDPKFQDGESVTEYASRMAAAWLGVCVSPRRHTEEAIEFSLNVLKEVLREDLTNDGPNRGAIAEAFLVELGELTRIMLDKTAGGDEDSHCRIINGAYSERVAATRPGTRKDDRE